MLMRKTSLQKYWPLYLLTTAVAFILRYFSKATDSDVINWMLAPTVRWVSVLSGITFEYLPHQGYASHAYYFLVAPSCAGIRFMMIAFLMLMFSSLHRIEKKKSGYLWFCFSIIFSYLATILVNSIRITASIHLPFLLKRAGLLDGWLTPDRLHTLTGTIVYFSSLCVIYLLSSSICKRWFLRGDAETSSALSPTAPTGACRIPSRRLIVPVFWYLLTVLVLPFCKRVVTNDWEGFGQYALLVLASCFVIAAVLYLPVSRMQRH